MGNELMTTGGNALNYADKEFLNTLRATVAKDATDAEFRMFVEFCKATGLNAIKREIWFIKPSGRVQMMTSAAGFFAIANAQPEYDGMDEGLITPDGSRVPLEYPKNDFIGAWCDVYRKDRRLPQKAVAMLSEYDKKQSNWNTMRRVMILKCAESLALRKSFPNELNGLYTAEEMPTEYSTPKAAPPKMDPRIISPEEIQDSLKGDYEQHITFTKPSKLYWYFLPKATDEQELYLNDHGCKKHGSTGVWECPKSLGKKLEAYKCDPLEYDEVVNIKTGEITEGDKSLWADDDTPEFLK